MINAVFFKDAEGSTTGLTVRGHAGYAEEGKDIICSATSAIMYAAAGALEDLAECSGCFCISQGIMEIDISKHSFSNFEDIRKAQTILKMTEIGLRQIELTYGSKFIKVKVNEDTRR